MLRIPVLVLLAIGAANCGAAPSASHIADYAAINRIRAEAGSCDGKPKPQLPELKARTELEDAARDASAGGNAMESLRRNSYRAVRTALAGMIAPNVTSLAATLQREFCRELGDPAFGDMGIHRDKGRVWLVLAVPAHLPEPSEWQAWGHAVLALTNEARKTARHCGDVFFQAAPPLSWNDRLASAALSHSTDMASRDYFSHQGRDGSQYDARISRAGYVFRAAGENIAAGQRTPEQALSSWLKSPGHCANIMRREFSESGAAFAIGGQSSKGIYWTQTFGAPR